DGCFRSPFEPRSELTASLSPQRSPGPGGHRRGARNRPGAGYRPAWTCARRAPPGPTRPFKTAPRSAVRRGGPLAPGALPRTPADLVATLDVVIRECWPSESDFVR